MTKQDIMQHLNNQRTVVLYTTKETIALNVKHTSLSVIDEILSSGTFRHNQIISGRVL
ncbi:MAG: hypothetical protein RR623_00340 [Bacilli bacterium]